MLPNECTVEKPERTKVDLQGQRLALAAFLVIVLFGGLNFVGTRFSNRELAPFWGAGVRFAGATLLLLGVSVVQRLPFPHGRALLGTVLYGVLGFGASYAFGYWAMLRVPAATASVVLASTPLFTFALAIAQGQERFRWRGLLGGVLALAGITVIFSRSASAAVPLASLLAILAMALCFAESSILVKQFPKSHPVSTNAVAMATGAVMLLAISAIKGEPRLLPTQPATWVALAYLILLGSSAAFVLYLFVLKRWTASATAYMFVLFPLVAVGAGAWLEGTPVTLSFMMGGSLVLGGVYVGAVLQASPAQVQAKMGTEPCLSCPT